jgi:serine/threonine-protein kinase
MPLAPGSTVGRYQLRSRLGGGAMGVVWLAVDPDLERRVALKLIAPALADDPDFRTRFLREARAAAAVDHPHVLPVYEAGTADEQLYLAMRYVPGVDLATRLARSGPLDLEATVRLVDHLAAALAAAHAVGIVHRDLKPGNVLLGPEEHAYLADFGLARSAASPGLTRPGQLVGTAAYTAPELLTGAEATPASDTYALACLTVEALTGSPPFTGSDELATLYAHAHQPPPDLSARDPDLPSELQAVIDRGLAKDPADRYPDPLAFAAGLRAAARAGSARTPDPMQSRLHPSAPNAPALTDYLLPGIGGIGFVIALVILTWAFPVPFTDNQPTEPQLVEYYVAQRTAALLAWLINMLALSGYIAFVHGVRNTQRDTGNDRLAALTWQLGIFGMVLTVLAGVVAIVPAFRIAEADPGTARAFWDASTFVDALSFLALAAFVGTASLGGLVTRSMPRLVGYLGVLVAPFALIAGLVVLADFSSVAGGGVRGLSFLAFLLWTGAVAIILIRRHLRLTGHGAPRAADAA